MSTQTKILITGDGGVGKTCAIERHFKGKFMKKYVAGTSITTYTFGDTIVHDYPGQYKFNFKDLTADLGPIDSAVIMYDLSSALSRRSVAHWIKVITDQFGDVPVKLVGTKADIGHLDAKLETSAKTGTNLSLVF